VQYRCGRTGPLRLNDQRRPVRHQPVLPDRPLGLAEHHHVEQSHRRNPGLAQPTHLLGRHVVAGLGLGHAAVGHLHTVLGDRLVAECLLPLGLRLGLLVLGLSQGAAVGGLGPGPQIDQLLVQVVDPADRPVVLPFQLTIPVDQGGPQLLALVEPVSKLVVVLQDSQITLEAVAALLDDGHLLAQGFQGVADLLVPLHPVEQVARTPAVPGRSGRPQLFPGPGPVLDPGLDDGHVPVPLLQRVRGLDRGGPVGVLGAAQFLFVQQFAVQPGECGDRVEHPVGGQFVQRLGQQVRGRAGPHRGGQE